jgi:hypothetical protein
LPGRVTIAPLTLLYATWVATHMREADRREIACQMHPDAELSDAGLACFHMTPEGWRWQAEIDGQPVACFGLARFTYPVWGGWAYGLPTMRRTIPAISRHFLAQRDRIIAEGCRCIEVRSIRGHRGAHLWINSLGGRYRCDLPDRGRDGETFELWTWELSEQSSPT